MSFNQKLLFGCVTGLIIAVTLIKIVTYPMNKRWESCQEKIMQNPEAKIFVRSCMEKRYLAQCFADAKKYYGLCE